MTYNYKKKKMYVKTGDNTALKMIWHGEVNLKLPKQQFVQDIISCLKQYKFGMTSMWPTEISIIAATSITED